jgi:predicted O-methyltransferase YrrM
MLDRARTLDRLFQADFHSGLGETAWLLYGLTKTLKPEVCVEIGSARGKSACFVGMALKENERGKLYAIDPHDTTDWNDPASVDSYPIMKANLEKVGVQNYVEIVRAYSQDAARRWDKPIDILFIDGDHSYEGVKRDWELFLPFVRPFGVVLFHDAVWPLIPGWQDTGGRTLGVPQLLDELRAEGYPVLTLDRDFGVSLVQVSKGGIPLQRELHPTTYDSYSQETGLRSKEPSCTESYPAPFAGQRR